MPALSPAPPTAPPQRAGRLLAVLLLAVTPAAPGLAAEAAQRPAEARPAPPWAVTVGDRNRDFAATVAVDHRGRTYLAGQFQGRARLLAASEASRVQSAGDTDLFLLALDPQGGLLWVRTFGGAGQDEARAVAVDAAGDVYLTGFFTRTARFGPAGQSLVATGDAGSSDAFVARLDGDGELAWVRGFGGERGDVGFDLAVDREGAVYVTGYFQGEADLDPGPGRHPVSAAGGTDAFVVKLDAAGGFVWARAAGGAAADEGRAVALGAGGGPVVAGNFVGEAAVPAGGASPATHGGRDVYVWWLDADGATRAVASLGGPGGDSIEDVAVDAAGGVAATGSFSAELAFAGETTPRPSRGPLDAFVARWDAAGRPSWLRTLGGDGADFGFGLAADPAGGLVVAGFSQLPQAASGRSGEFRSWVRGLDAAGEPAWQRELSSDTAIQALGLALAPGGWPHVAGIFKGTARIELGERLAELPPRGKFDVFVARLRP